MPHTVTKIADLCCALGIGPPNLESICRRGAVLVCDDHRAAPVVLDDFDLLEPLVDAGIDGIQLLSCVGVICDRSSAVVGDPCDVSYACLFGRADVEVVLAAVDHVRWTGEGALE